MAVVPPHDVTVAATGDLDSSSEMISDQEVPDEALKGPDEALIEPIAEDPRLSINGCMGVPSGESIEFVDVPRQAELLKELENIDRYYEGKFKRACEPNILTGGLAAFRALKALDNTGDIRSARDEMEAAKPKKVETVPNPYLTRAYLPYKESDKFPSTEPLSEAAFQRRAFAAAPKGSPAYSTGMPLTYQAVAVVESCLNAEKEQITLEEYLALVRMTTRRLAARIKIPAHMPLPGYEACTMYCVSWEDNVDECSAADNIRAKALKTCSTVAETIPELDDESLEKARSFLNDTKYTKVTLDEVIYDLRRCRGCRSTDWHLRLPPVERLVMMPKDGDNEQGAMEYVSIAQIINPILELSKGSVGKRNEQAGPKQEPVRKSTQAPSESKKLPTITGFVWHNRVGRPYGNRKVTFRGFEGTLVSTSGNEEVIIAKDGSYKLMHLDKITKATTFVNEDVITGKQAELIRVRDERGRVDFLFKE
ncbi:MAG: hypothetical protein H7Y39_01885 [Nitrospiraceae bacterium]|nr:hypothetical protein [Nitrospiraceae bacterium]